MNNYNGINYDRCCNFSYQKRLDDKLVVCITNGGNCVIQFRQFNPRITSHFIFFLIIFVGIIANIQVRGIIVGCWRKLKYLLLNYKTSVRLVIGHVFLRNSSEPHRTLLTILSIFLPIMSKPCWGPRHMRIKLQDIFKCLNQGRHVYTCNRNRFDQYQKTFTKSISVYTIYFQYMKYYDVSISH